MAYSFGLASADDVDIVLTLFAEASEWHRRIGVSAWPPFEVDRVNDDVANGCLFVMRKGSRIVGSVTITDNDPLIWGDTDDALYIHRLAISRSLKGEQLGRSIIERIDAIAGTRQKRFLRLDCWASNERLKAYYRSIGFLDVGNCTVGNELSLPLHYRNSTTTKFEMAVKSAPHASAAEFDETSKHLARIST